MVTLLLTPSGSKLVKHSSHTESLKTTWNLKNIRSSNTLVARTFNQIWCNRCQEKHYPMGFNLSGGLFQKYFVLREPLVLKKSFIAYCNYEVLWMFYFEWICAYLQFHEISYYWEIKHQQRHLFTYSQVLTSYSIFLCCMNSRSLPSRHKASLNKRLMFYSKKNTY